MLHVTLLKVIYNLFFPIRAVSEGIVNTKQHFGILICVQRRRMN